MTKLEVVQIHKKAIKAEMLDSYRAVLESHGNMQVKVYIWEDGEIETLCDTCSSNTWLQPRRGESRQLFYVTTISFPFFCWTDYAYDGDVLDDSMTEERVINEECERYALELNDTFKEILDEIKLDEILTRSWNE